LPAAYTPNPAPAENPPIELSATRCPPHCRRKHRQHRPGHREQAEHVGLEHRAGLFDGGLLDRAEQACAGIVDQHVDPAEPGKCRIDDLARPALVGHVVREGE
jgi:hypothetical protein